MEYAFALINSTWVAPTGLPATLAADGADWTLSFLDGSVLRFDSSGVLTKESDANANETTYVWSGDDLTITADNGQTIAVDCNGSGQVDDATYATNDGTRVVDFSTSSPWQVTYFDGEDEEYVIEYGYASSLLASIEQLDWPAAGSDVAEQFSYETGKLITVYFADYDAATKLDARANITYPTQTTATVTRKGSVGAATNQDTCQTTYEWNGGANDVKLPAEVIGCPEVGGLENTTTYTYGEHLGTFQEVREDENEVLLTEMTYYFDSLGRTTQQIENLGDKDEDPEDEYLTTTYTYESGHDQPTSETATNSSGETVRDIDCTYNATTHTLATVEELLDADESQTSHSEYAYDGNGCMTTEERLISGTVQSGTWAVTTYSDFADSGEPETVTYDDVVRSYGGAAADLERTRSYDELGNLLTETELHLTTEQNPTPVATNTYDLAGRLTQSTDASGVVTHNTYDVMGNLIETWKTASGTDVKADWSKYYEGPIASPTAYGYDAVGRQTGCWTYLHNGTAATLQSTTTTSYDGLGNETEATDTTVGGADEQWRYDQAGNATDYWELGAAGDTDAYDTDESFDPLGQVTSETEPGNSADTEFTYDMAGNLVEQENPDGSSVAYTYDDEGNLEKMEESSESSAVLTTDPTPNEGDLLSAETTPDSLAVDYDFDLLGRQTVADPSGVAGDAETVYNSLGWVLRELDGDGIATIKTYDAAGRLIAESRDDRLIEYAYNGVGLVTSQVEKDSAPDPDVRISTLAYTYDAFGRMTEEQHTVDGAVVKETDYVVDSLGRTTGSEESAGGGLSETIDYPDDEACGTTETITYDDGDAPQTEVTIDNDAREQESTRAAEIIIGPGTPPAPPQTTTITRTVTARDAAERWTTATLTGGLSFVRTFDSDDGQLTGQSGDGFTSAGSYGYNADSGRKTSENLPLDLGSSMTSISYSYHTTTGRLKTASLGGLSSTTWDVSGYGNLEAFTDAGGTADLDYNSSHQLTDMSYGGTTTEFSYDADFGWRTEQGPSADPDQITYGYSLAGELISFDDTDVGISADYAYDAAGQRIESVVDDGSVITTTDYTYDGITLFSLVADPDSGDDWRIDYLYDEEGRPCAGTYRSTADSTSATFFVIITTDRGDVVELLDEDGDAFAAYRYDEWGNPIGSGNYATGIWTDDTANITSTLAGQIAERQVLRYAGYAFDAESGLYYCSARYYDPYTRQFISKDPADADGEGSPYQYCGGNPVESTDPSGQEHTNWKERLVALRYGLLIARLGQKAADFSWARVRYCRDALSWWSNDGLDNGKGDAVRHALWAANMCQQFYRHYYKWFPAYHNRRGRRTLVQWAYQAAKDFGDAHEWRRPHPQEVRMDLFNNSYGRHFWLDHKKRTMRGWWATKRLRSAAEHGKLRILHRRF